MTYTVDLLRRRGIEPTMVLLLDRIKKRTGVTYGEIARMLPGHLGVPGATIFPVHIGVVAGALMDRIRDHSPNAPLITLLVVNGETGQPGKGSNYFLDSLPGMGAGAAKRLQPRDRKRLVDRLSQEVYDYPGWSTVFRQIFKHSPPDASDVGLEVFHEQDGKAGDWGGRQGEESAHHKRLKQHVLDNPHLLSIGAVTAKSAELPLLSGDMVDVFVATADVSYVIEVKSRISSDDDLKRGLYQCLKYRAVLAAQQETRPDDGSVSAKLVTERHPTADLWALARRLRVTIHVLEVLP